MSSVLDASCGSAASARAGTDLRGGSSGGGAAAKTGLGAGLGGGRSSGAGANAEGAVTVVLYFRVTRSCEYRSLRHFGFAWPSATGAASEAAAAAVARARSGASDGDAVGDSDPFDEAGGRGSGGWADGCGAVFRSASFRIAVAKMTINASPIAPTPSTVPTSHFLDPRFCSVEFMAIARDHVDYKPNRACPYEILRDRVLQPERNGP